MTRHYCTYFDSRYLVRGLAMIRSLRRFEQDARIWILCLDDECHDLMSALDEPGVIPIPLREVEHGDQELAEAKANRSLIEYYFTLTPVLVCYVLDRSSPGDTVTYVDGDLFFFSDPSALYAELAAGDVSIIAHRFPPKLKRMERFGRFNVGWLTFACSPNAAAVAAWWRARCIEWCYDVVEENRFADQKYLEDFGRLFEGVVELQHPGANLAPWNVGGHAVSVADGRIVVDGHAPLVFFHFHGFKRLARCAYAANHSAYRAPFWGVIRRHIYRPYVAALVAVGREVRQLNHTRKRVLPRSRSHRRSITSRILARARNAANFTLSLVRGEIVLVVAGRPL